MVTLHKTVRWDYTLNLLLQWSWAISISLGHISIRTMSATSQARAIQSSIGGSFLSQPSFPTNQKVFWTPLPWIKINVLRNHHFPWAMYGEYYAGFAHSYNRLLTILPWWLDKKCFIIWPIPWWPSPHEAACDSLLTSPERSGQTCSGVFSTLQQVGKRVSLPCKCISFLLVVWL